MNDAPITAATGLPFIKMHGLGNDFVVLDARRRGFALDAARVRLIADRRAGVGCDQLFVLEKPTDPAADVFMRIYNSDGGEVEACGNGARCVAALLMREKGANSAMIETVAGVLGSQAAPDGRVTVDMGQARLGWREIPLAEAHDTNHVPVSAGSLSDASCANMGNPHAVFFVPDASAVDLRTVGPQLEHHPMFPARANIGVAQILGPGRIRFRVWERGVGVTMACGTGACAALVAASRRGLVQRKAEMVMDGGSLGVEWLADGRVLMTGEVAISFTGTLAPSFLA
jgi:diaminopimelate epimerase